MMTTNTERRSEFDEANSPTQNNPELSPTTLSSQNVSCKMLLFGQFLSFFLSGSGAVSTTLESKCNVNSPTAQSALMYLLLSFHILFVDRQQRSQQKRLIATNMIETRNNNPTTATTTTTTLEDQSFVSLPGYGDDCSYRADGGGDDDDDDSNDGTEVYFFPFTRLPLRAPWYFYFVLAFLDVEAMYLTYLAYRYTSLTSITILSSMSIPTCVVFSRLILKRKYDIWHFFGILSCLTGLVISVFSDMLAVDGDADSVKTNNDNGLRHSPSFSVGGQVHGDLLALAGAALFGLNDTISETFVKKINATEYLGMIGVFGTIISAVQILILERDFVDFFLSGSMPCDPSTSVLLYFTNTAFLYLFYVALSLFLLRHDAASLQISLLTGNFFAVIFVIVAQKTYPSVMFFIALAFVIVGVLVYESGMKTLQTKSNMTIRLLCNEDDDDKAVSK